jgi:hypothetical protein
MVTAPPAAAYAADQCAGCEQPLRVIRVDSTRTQKRTLYEVAPNAVVTLVEIDSAAAADAPATIQPQEAATSSPRLDSRRISATGAAAARASVATPSAPVPPTTQTAGFANVQQTIQWKDAATGRVLRLSGPFTAERLQEIRRRIELERAARKKR